MSEQADLLTLRAELKRELADGTYDPLAERISKWFHRIFPRLPKGDVAPFLILSGAHVLLSWILDYSDDVAVFRQWVITAFLTVFFFWFAIFLYARLYLLLYGVISNYVIDAMTQPNDIRDLSRWLGRFHSMGWTLFFSVLALALIMPYHYPIISNIYGGLGVRTSMALIGGYFVLCIANYLLMTMMVFPLILSRYHIDLYEVDPKMSPSILHISVYIRNSAYILSVYSAFFTLLVVYIGIPAFPTALFYMIPLVCIFIFRQIALSRIVTRAREVVLERLRHEIEALDIEQNFDDPALCNQFKAMADYYDSVRNASTGVFDMRAGFLIINSVLLPSTAFIISHFDQVRAFFGW